MATPCQLIIVTGGGSLIMPTTMRAVAYVLKAPMTADLMPAIQLAVWTRVRKPAIWYCLL